MTKSSEKENERMAVLRECAILAAKSAECSTATGYAIAREIWSLWWREKDLFEKQKTATRNALIEFLDDERV